MKTEMICRESDIIGEKYWLGRHESGLELLVYPKKMATSYAMFATRFGSIDNCFRIGGAEESDFIHLPDGVAHFLEHKLFDNEGGEDAAAQFARTGANCNAYTSFDITAYLFSCADRVYDSLSILLHFATHPYFTEQSVNKEQGIIGQEIRMYEDNPGTRLFFDCVNALYHNHNIRLDICGTEKSISRITPQLLYRCCDAFYHPSNMALAVCGDVEPDRVVACVDAALPAGRKPVFLERVETKEPEEIVRPYTERRMPVAKPLFAIGMKDMDPSSSEVERSRRDLAMKILNLMLYGKTSAFYTELYESGLIGNDYDVEYEGCRGCNFNLLSGESRDPKELYARFRTYISDMLKKGLDPAAFERCRKVIYAAVIRTFDSTEDIASELIYNHFDGGDFFSVPREAAAMTFSYVERVFREFYSRDCFALSVVWPLTKEA